MSGPLGLFVFNAQTLCLRSPALVGQLLPGGLRSQGALALMGQGRRYGVTATLRGLLKIERDGLLHHCA